MPKPESVLDFVTIAEAVSQDKDWKEALDSVMAVVRSGFIFDNLALYIADVKDSKLTEVAYARAVGRGQSAGGDAAWGVEVANHVMERN